MLSAMIPKEENHSYIPDKYFFYQDHLNVVKFLSESQKKKKKNKNKISIRISIKLKALTVVTHGYWFQNSAPNV